MPTEIGLLLAHRSNFGWMPFLVPPMTCVIGYRWELVLGTKMHYRCTGCTIANDVTITNVAVL